MQNCYRSYRPITDVAVIITAVAVVRKPIVASKYYCDCWKQYKVAVQRDGDSLLPLHRR